MSNPDAIKTGALRGAPAAKQGSAPTPADPVPADWPDTLRRTRPHLSAGEPMWRWQKAALAVALFLLAVAIGQGGTAAVTVLLALLSPVFLCVVAIRAAALWQLGRREAAGNAAVAVRAPEGDWPIYSVLVPVLRERDVLVGLVRALQRLEWPRDKLDVLFVTEAADDATRFELDRVLDEIGDRTAMRVLVVPAGMPQTKPRALMYALPHARGSYVVVYDAEDEPEPDQLRRAFAALSEPGARIGCVQAALNVDNAQESWIARQFALEYTALFDAILPALERLRLPVPLGGTSNHFRRDVLEEAGGWDPYNVTEDADLGIRLARTGWRVSVLASTTWEEAPATFAVWFRQRTRWLKGWMQTCLVHLREPRVLRRELGGRAFAGFTVLMTGMILSALIHPLFYGVAIGSLVFGDGHLLRPGDGLAAAAWWLGALNLAAAYGLGGGLAVAAVRRRGHPGLARHAVLIPVYWLMISAAAYGALAGLVLAPSRWQKTDHTGRWRRRRACGPIAP